MNTDNLDKLLERLYNVAWVEGNNYDDTAEQAGTDTEVRSAKELRWCETTKQAIEAYIAEQNAEAFIKWGWGERCESTDKEDFPDTDYEDPNNARCANCEMWEHYDEWLDHLSKKGDIESDIEHQPVDIETKIKALKRPDAPKAVYMIEAELTDLVELIDTENTNSRLVELDLLEQALNDGRDMHQYKMMRLKELTNDI